MDLQVAPIRSVRLGNMSAEAEHRADGTVVVRSVETLGSYPRSIVDALESWARKTPDTILIADRHNDAWRTMTFAEVLEQIRPLGQALLDAGPSAERPLMIISGNEIEHFLLGLAAIWVGIPYAPISPAYSLVSTDFGKLKHIAGLLTPGMVYASDGAKFGPAIAATFGPDVKLVVRTNPPADRPALVFNDLLKTEVTPAVAAAHEAITPDTVAKVLFTSGST